MSASLANLAIGRTIPAVTEAPPTGRLIIVHGSMFAGKTEYVIARLRAEEACGRSVRAFKHAIDARYAADYLVTHARDRYPALRVDEPAAILPQLDQVDVVAVDEGHFFKRPLIPVVRALLERGLDVLVAGLTYDAWGRPFEPFPNLLLLADEVVVCRAPCRVCGRPAPYTQRLALVRTEFLVGGAGDYEPRCAAHFVALPEPPEQG